MRCVYDFTQLYQLAAINAVPNHLAFSASHPPENLPRTGRCRENRRFFVKNRRFSAP